MTYRNKRGNDNQAIQIIITDDGSVYFPWNN